MSGARAAGRGEGESVADAMTASIEAVAAALRDRTISCRELVASRLALADRVQDELAICTARFDEPALAAAERIDRDFAAGIDRGPLQGIPVGAKDIILTKEAPTGAGGALVDPFWQERRDGPAVAALRRRGAIPIAKLTTLELAFGMPDAGGQFPLCRTPWDPGHWAGGSSSGSGSAVGAGVVLAALGTDTGGSVRIPASYCGVTGLKPTHGLVSLDGVIPFAPAYDCVGPITRSADDAALVLEAITDGRFAAAGESERRRSDRSGDGRLDGMRIGVQSLEALPSGLLDEPVSAAFERAVAELAAGGATLVAVELPHFQEATDVNRVGMFAEGFDEHAGRLRRSWSAFQRRTRVAFASGAFVGPADRRLVAEATAVVRGRVDELMRSLDAVAIPTTATAAPRPTDEEIQRAAPSALTHYWSTVGGPAISVPMGFDRGLPLGLQLCGRPFDDHKVLRVARAFQARTDWHARVPPALAEAAHGP